MTQYSYKRKILKLNKKPKDLGKVLLLLKYS